MSDLHVCLDFARSPWARCLGLMGRKRYPPARALVFEECNAVHTWFMRMPIDVLFVDRDYRVLAIWSRVPPWRVARDPRAHAVLELRSGEAASLGLRPGDRIEPCYERNARQTWKKLGALP